MSEEIEITSEMKAKCHGEYLIGVRYLTEDDQVLVDDQVVINWDLVKTIYKDMYNCSPQKAELEALRSKVAELERENMDYKSIVAVCRHSEATAVEQFVDYLQEKRIIPRDRPWMAYDNYMEHMRDKIDEARSKLTPT